MKSSSLNLCLIALLTKSAAAFMGSPMKQQSLLNREQSQIFMATSDEHDSQGKSRREVFHDTIAAAAAAAGGI
jgi:hypothetical protein